MGIAFRIKLDELADVPVYHECYCETLRRGIVYRYYIYQRPTTRKSKAVIEANFRYLTSGKFIHFDFLRHLLHLSSWLLRNT